MATADGQIVAQPFDAVKEIAALPKDKRQSELSEPCSMRRDGKGCWL
jgi:hypothetical protein